jgi:hypothetical protein
MPACAVEESLFASPSPPGRLAGVVCSSVSRADLLLPARFLGKMNMVVISGESATFKP